MQRSSGTVKGGPKVCKASTAERASPNTEERYRLVIEAVAEGIYEWSTDTNHLELSSRLNEMLGFEKGELTSGSWLEHVHPDDRGRYRDATIAYFKGVVPHFACEYRVLNKSGQWRWVSDRASSIRNADGRVLRLVGAITDVTDLKQIEAQLREALEQQTATADALRVISRSNFELQTVLNSLVESATRLCDADHAWLFQREGEHFSWRASFGHATDVHDRIKDFFKTRPVLADRGSATGRAALEGRVVHISDVLLDAEYTYGEAQKIAGYRAALGVPLLRQRDVIGVIFVAKIAPQPFTEKQIELVTTFADQAVIAIENVRLFEAEQARTRELSVSLEQQTATSQVLQVISSSPGELQPVFEAMLENATRLCEAKFGILFRYEGGLFYPIASLDVPPAFADFLKRQGSFAGKPGQLFGRLSQSKRVIHVVDRTTEPELSPSVRYAGARSCIAVPMLKESELVGAFFIYRTEVRPFTDKQIELVKNFAAQAVIAVENARLLSELRESLQRQTATADVLKVISRSTFDLSAVLNTLVESAVRLCDGYDSVILLREGEWLVFGAHHGHMPMDFDKWPLTRRWTAGRAVIDAKPVHVHDLTAAPDEFPDGHAMAIRLGHRTILSVPLLREGEAIGSLTVRRAEVRPFTDKQIELVKTFADQAVIAIENVRLFDEVQARTRELSESLEQQTATSEVLKVISSSPGELGPVFETMLANATRICEATSGNLFLREGPIFRSVAVHSKHGHADSWRRNPVFDLRDNPGVPLERVASTKQVVHIADFRTDQSYIGKNPRVVTLVEVAGARTYVCVPMLKEGKLVGAISMFRQEVRPFTDKQLALVKNFADQAVIAIENTRLLNELRESLQRQTATSEVLKVIASSTGDLQPIFSALLANAAQLCEAIYGALWRCKGDQWNAAAMHGDLPPAYLDWWRNGSWFNPGPNAPMPRAAASRQPLHIPDMREDISYRSGGALPVSAVEVAGVRTLLCVPMMRENEVVGAIAIYRKEIRPFTDKQIEVIQNFAAQAVIAIENARLLNELRQRTDDLSESLEQQTATSEVLKVISSSPGELNPVFEAILENATRICEAKFGNLFLYADNSFRIAAQKNAPPAYAERWRQRPVIVVGDNPHNPLDRLAASKSVIDIPDLMAEPGYMERDPRFVALVEAAGARTHLAVPMLKENELVGAISIFRQDLCPFTSKQIELVQSFASQAVIAIENARLLNELRQRTDDLSESLEQQTATSKVLGIISSSPGDLEPVFNAMLENAVRICAAKFGSLVFFEGDAYRRAALYNAPAALLEQQAKNPVRPLSASSFLTRMAGTKEVVQVTDMLVEQPDEAIVKFGGARTVLSVPLLRNDQTAGVFTIYRQEVRPFTDKQIQLVKNFAAQAVIAIENTRLLNELRESLEQQTATSEVLKVISSSPGELESVFQAMLENATRICQAKYGVMFLHENGTFRTRALCGVPPALAEERQRNPVIQPSPRTGVGRVLRTKKTAHIADVLAEPEYIDVPAGFTKPGIVQFGGARTELAVPMLKDDELVGTIVIYRTEVLPFTDKQIELVTNFAAQAVIAIENARLLNELRSRTNELAQSVGELQALGEVSQAVNSTLDLETVLTTIVGRAVELSRTDAGAIYVFNDERKEFRLHATYGMSETMIAAISDQHIGVGDGNNIATATTQRKPVQVADTRDEPASAVNDIVLREGYRSILIIPLLRPDHIVGALVVRRKTPGDFSQSTIDLLQTFADQSVVAIQNARLYENVETRTRELAKSLEDLRTTQDRLVQTQKLASLGQLTAGIAHEIKNPLNFVNNFSGISTELIDELQDALKDLPIDQTARAEIKELTDTLKSNLDKIVQHGKRADAIVKNMLLHSREGSGDHRVIEINALVEESLNLAWHGARAEKPDFNISLERSFDPAAGEADVFPQDITRVLLNFISNGFYAATQRREETNGSDYEPILAASTKNLGDRVEIMIRDNGTGILPDVKEKMFNPFFTTKPAGEGTGLGLSISHDIIVKQHGGSIDVDTMPGEFTAFRITLPRNAAAIGKAGAST